MTTVGAIVLAIAKFMEQALQKNDSPQPEEEWFDWEKDRAGDFRDPAHAPRSQLLSREFYWEM